MLEIIQENGDCLLSHLKYITAQLENNIVSFRQIINMQKIYSLYCPLSRDDPPGTVSTTVCRGFNMTAAAPLASDEGIVLGYCC